MSRDSLSGGCYCGAVRYRMDAEPIFVNACHCRDCQKLSGSAFAVNAMIERDRLEIIGGRGAATDPDGEMWCMECGCSLWATVPHMFGRNIVFLRAGTLDESERLVPDAHFFVRSRHPWVTIPDGTPTFETQPDGGEGVLPEAAAARVAAAMR